MYLPLINGLAAIVIHSSHLSDNALIHYTNKHIPPGYLCVCVVAMLVAKQEAENSRWCWLINWQVNFQMDNESKTLKDGMGEVSGPLLYLGCSAIYLLLAEPQLGAGTHRPCQMFVPSRLNEVSSFMSVYPCYIPSEHINQSITEIKPYSICTMACWDKC